MSYEFSDMRSDVACHRVTAQKSLDIAHACVRMFYTGTWAPGVDTGPVQEVLGRKDVATVIHSCVMRLRRRLQVLSRNHVRRGSTGENEVLDGNAGHVSLYLKHKALYQCF